MAARRHRELLIGLPLVIAAALLLPASLFVSRSALARNLLGITAGRSVHLPLDASLLQRADGQSLVWIRPTYLFVGYRSCSSVCPAVLSELRTFRDRIPPGSADFLFVSIDPVRDDRKRLLEFQEALGPYFSAATFADRSAAQSFLRQAGLRITARPEAGVTEYIHPDRIILVRRDGNGRLLYERDPTADELFADFQQLGLAVLRTGAGID